MPMAKAAGSQACTSTACVTIACRPATPYCALRDVHCSGNITLQLVEPSPCIVLHADDMNITRVVLYLNGSAATALTGAAVGEARGTPWRVPS